MIGLGMSSAGNVPTVDHVQVVALYDPATGKIRHLHMISTLTGAKPPAEADAIAEAKARAARHAGADKLEAALSNDPQHALQPHSIDPATKAFVPIPADRPASA
jgi:hypothetical protein